MGRTEETGAAQPPLYPKNEYDPAAARLLLDVARTYLDHADRFIYSGAGRTFLSGYDLFDEEHGGRGNIDCSSLVFLTMAGIPYEKSPYATGTVKGLQELTAPWADPELIRFDLVPERYIPITERIGRPDLAGEGTEGISLAKAKAEGFDWKAVMSKVRGTGLKRRSCQMAEYYWDRGECFSDPESLRPGDLIFYKSTKSWREGYRFFGVFREIAHVGMAWEDPSMMINSVGYQDKNRALAEGLPAVSLDPVCGKREPDLFVRPFWKSE